MFFIDVINISCYWFNSPRFRFQMFCKHLPEVSKVDWHNDMREHYGVVKIRYDTQWFIDYRPSSAYLQIKQ